MSKKISYGVSYQVYGRATATVPDYIQTKDEAIEWLKERWDELPLPEADYVPESDELDLESDIEIWEDPFEEKTNVDEWHSSEASMSTPDGVYEVRGDNDKFI